MAESLHSVRVQKRAASMDNIGDFFERLDGADFVIRVHHRHENRVVGQGVGDGLRRDGPELVYRQISDAEAKRFEKMGGFGDGFMLNLRGD